MKKKFIYIATLLLLLSVSATYGQDNAEVPRRTAEEQAAFEKSVTLNPANAGPLVDPKMDPEQLPQAGPVNWKAAPLVDEDNVATELAMPESASVTSPPASSGKNQPEGAKPQGTTVNHRDMKGEKTQADAPNPGVVTSLRDMKGSKTQPEGEKPKR